MLRVSRRGILRGFAASLLLVAFATSAQDPRDAIVQNAARTWLALVDVGDAPASWKAAGKKFQDVITPERWAEGLQVVRGPLGPLTQRAVVSTHFGDEFPGGAKGEYATVQFRSSFANRELAGETLTLEREADGVWHVIGYTVQ